MNTQSEKTVPAMDIHAIIECLPHRYPFLLVDRVLSVEPGKSIVALKNVTINEPFFPGHYPHHPVMPGVLIIEAMAQVAALLSFQTMEKNPDEKSVYYFAGIDGAHKKLLYEYFKHLHEKSDKNIREIFASRLRWRQASAA